MSKVKLDKDEKRLLETYEAGEFKSKLTPARKREIKEVATHTLKKDKGGVAMPNKNIQSEDIPHEKSSLVSIERLVFDKKNPRLISFESNSSDEAIIAQLYRSEDLGELLQSIAANGYLDIEPLIVLKEDNLLVVLEGNRRLAAIRLFREPQLLSRISEKYGLRISLPQIAEDKLKTLEEVSVYRVLQREDARSFIGFKHINGAARWNSYAKGQFAAEWYRSGNISLDEIANKIGDRHETIKRMIYAIYVLEQAENEGIFKIEDRWNPKFSFSHLYTALSRKSYADFLQLGSAEVRDTPKENPIPEEKKEELQDVLRWLYGSKEDDTKPVIQSQNPDVKRLGEVLSNKEALHILRAGDSLEQAYASIQPAEDRFAEGLLKVRHYIREAANSLRGFDGNDQSLINIAEDIVETSQTILERMRKKRSMQFLQPTTLN